ncbi:MAG TPA: F0F1 ATP synthase subunit delta [Steroidobacteraceae bacterium]|nr:F0F1 ATP synthase subunit delta [Steroidobacteraceae bacterium]
MADRLTVARPYARAAFAQAGSNLGSWSEALGRAAAAVGDARVRALFGSPKVSAQQLAGLVADVAGPSLDQNGRNFLQLLAENGRLQFLPEISQLFDKLKAEAEHVVDVSITSAAPMGEDEQQKLVTALETRFKRKVRVQSAVDPSLIGGAVVRAGDLTIDGSVKARLERLAHDLTA